MAAALGYNSRIEAGTIGSVCEGISLISAIFASIWICARYAVAVQACVAEDIGSRLALKRSTFLTAGRPRPSNHRALCLSHTRLGCGLHFRRAHTVAAQPWGRIPDFGCSSWFPCRGADLHGSYDRHVSRLLRGARAQGRIKEPLPDYTREVFGRAAQFAGRNRAIHASGRTRIHRSCITFRGSLRSQPCISDSICELQIAIHISAPPLDQPALPAEPE